MNILLVEDNEGDSFYITELLNKQSGYFIEIAPNLRTAIKFAYQKHYDIILLDLFLPDSRGLETFYRFRIVHTFVPVIILTGLNDREAALMTVAEGAQDYIVKSELATESLIRSLSFALERFKYLSSKMTRTQLIKDTRPQEVEAMEILRTNAEKLKEMYDVRISDAGTT